VVVPAYDPGGKPPAIKCARPEFVSVMGSPRSAFGTRKACGPSFSPPLVFAYPEFIRLRDLHGALSQFEL